jgi:hypothetical protein
MCLARMLAEVCARECGAGAALKRKINYIGGCGRRAQGGRINHGKMRAGMLFITCAMSVLRRSWLGELVLKRTKAYSKLI